MEDNIEDVTIEDANGVLVRSREASHTWRFWSEAVDILHRALDILSNRSLLRHICRFRVYLLRSTRPCTNLMRICE